MVTHKNEVDGEVEVEKSELDFLLWHGHLWSHEVTVKERGSKSQNIVFFVTYSISFFIMSIVFSE